MSREALQPRASPDALDPVSLMYVGARRATRAADGASWPPNVGIASGPAPTTTDTRGDERQPPLAAPQGVGTSFLVDTLSLYEHADPSMGVSETQVLIATNEIVRVFDKNGVAGPLHAGLQTFFSVVSSAPRIEDGLVRYDPTSGRWFVAARDFTIASQANNFLLAVSDGPVITGSSGFTFYSFQQDLVAPAGDTGLIVYFPKFAVDANALYFGAQVGGLPGYLGTSAWVVRKSSVISGGPIVATAFRALAGAAGTPGIKGPMGVDNVDPLASEGYFIGVSQDTFGLLLARRVTDPGGSPSISAEIPIPVPTTVYPQSQAHMDGGGDPYFFNTLDDRLFAAMIHKNRLTGTASLWTAHHIEVDDRGVALATGNRNGSRWYQIDDLAGTPTLAQAGTLYDATPGIQRGYCYPSVAASGQGHMAMATSFASNSEYIGIAAAGRLFDDTPGATRPPTVAMAGQSYLNGSGWGQCSNMAVDPSDDQTMWAIAQYCPTPNTWGVRVVKLLAPPPATPSAASPDHVVEGATNVSVIVTGIPVDGSGFYDTEPGMNRMAASVMGGGVTVNSATFTSATSITLDISIAPGAAIGPRPVEVTNPDGQSTVSLAGILHVDSSTCIAFSQYPAGQSTCINVPATFSVSVSGASAPTYQWRKDGVDIVGAQAASYTIPVVALTDAGSYDVVVVDVCGTATSVAATLEVENPCIPGVPFCFGDGSLATPCPCVPPNLVPSPSGAPGHGCANSFDLDGALLTAVGNVVPDAVVFTSNVGWSYQGFGFLFKGNATVASGVGVSDGIRCASGQLIRFGGHNAGSNGDPIGKWRYPNAVQTTPVTAATLQPPGQSAYYQHYYRNAAANFCNSSTANLSNGIQIAWP